MTDALDAGRPEPRGHKFQPPAGKPWGLCVVCWFGQAAHDDCDPYVSEAPRAPKGAVRPGVAMHTSDVTKEES
jgi:hypothetical protein